MLRSDMPCCAGDCLNDTREHDQDTVASRLDDAALVFSDLRVDQLAAMDTQACQRAGLVGTH